MFLVGLWIGLVAGYWWANLLEALYDQPTKITPSERGMDNGFWDEQRRRNDFIRGSHG